MAPSAPIASSMVCNRRRVYSLSTKREIVKEANRVSTDKFSVFRVARKHHVLPCQIGRRRKQFEQIDAIITNNDDYEESQEVIHDSQSWYSNTNNVVDCSILNRSNKKNNRVSAKNLTRFPGTGRKSLFSKNMMNGLKDFYFEQRELTNSVSVMQLRIHARSISEVEVDSILSTNVIKPNHVVNQRLYRLLSKWDQSWRRGTHRAQNTRYEISVQNDFTSYLNQKIKRLGIPKEHVFNPF
jgi:transposase-like protein